MTKLRTDFKPAVNSSVLYGNCLLLGKLNQ